MFIKLEGRWDFMGNAKVLITGINGHVGGALAERLIQEKFEVHGLSRKHSSLDKLRNRGVDKAIKMHNWENPNTWHDEFDIVIHLAAPGMLPSDSYQDIALQDTQLLIQLTENIKAHPKMKFIYTGTCFEYMDGASLKEDSPVFPRSGYALAKINGWSFVKGFCFSKEAQAVCLRLFTVYGPYESQHRIIPSLLMSSLKSEPLPLTEGVQTRDFVYLDDVVEAYMKVCKAELKRPFPVYNISTGVETSVRGLVDKISTTLKVKLNVKFGALPNRTKEYMRLSGDFSSAQKDLGWKPQVSLEEGIQKTWKWIKK